MRVMVVEDEAKTSSFVRKALAAGGFTVDTACEGREALAAILRTPLDAVILDIMLPGLDGLGVLRELRERRCNVPVLLLSARGMVDDRVQGFDLGADDYLAKPFALAELVARVRALCRRQTGSAPIILQLADLTLDTVTHQVRRGQEGIPLSVREYALLEFLMRQQGRVCSRMQIVEKVWSYHFDPESNLVDVYVRHLREKIDAGCTNKLLHTVRGVGYVMKESS